MAFLDLEHESDSENKYESINKNCNEQIFSIDKHSVLANLIKEFDSTKYEKQKQLPNPTVIHTYKKNEDDQVGKTVVFTSFFRQS